MRVGTLVAAIVALWSSAGVAGQCGPRQLQKLLASDGKSGDKFGFAVDYDGSFAVVGAIGHGHTARDAGAAWVFGRAGARFVERTELRGRDTTTGDWFGCAVAIDGDTILVGSRADDDKGGNSGSAYVFVRQGSGWVQQAKLVASDGKAADLFGDSVALDGDTAAIGATGVQSRTGAVYVFVRGGGRWTQQQKVMARDPARLDGFGWSVALERDTLVVGSIGDDDKGDRSGSVYVYGRRGKAWSHGQKLNARDGSAGDNFGVALALQDGTLAIGTPGDGDRGRHSGSAYVFTRGGGTWREAQKLLAKDGSAGAQFGEAVALDGNTLVVGAWNARTITTGTGAAYVYTRAGARWAERRKLVANDAKQSDNLGGSIGLAGDTAFIGAQNTDDRGNNSGSTYVFTLQLAGWASFGAGWPGTNGVPGFAASAPPLLGTTVVLALDNSSGRTTAGLLFVGQNRISVPTPLDGRLHVLPLAAVPLTVPSRGMRMLLQIPGSDALCGLTVVLQVIQIDARASKGWSFTPGLELELGR